MEEQRPCRRIRRVDESVSNWEFCEVKPINTVGGLNPFVMGEMEYYYTRSFSEIYECSCNGKTARVIVEDNYEVGVLEDPENKTYVCGLISIPLPGVGSFWQQVSREILERIFGSSSGLGLGPISMERPLIEQRATELIVMLEPYVKERYRKPVPIAICGKQIKFDEDDIRPWPTDDQDFHVPTEEERNTEELLEMINRLAEGIAVMRRRSAAIAELEQEDSARAREERRQLDSLRRSLSELLDRLPELLREVLNTN